MTPGSQIFLEPTLVALDYATIFFSNNKGF